MKTELCIEPATLKDIDRIMEIFSTAKKFMRSAGNPGQWNGAYPDKELIAGEIRDKHCFVVKDRSGKVAGTFCLILGDDPTYREIEGGSWLNDEPYGTIHRIASDGTTHGIGHACFEFSAGIIGNLRADTHRDNAPMLGLLEKEGFSRCGTIHLKDGSPRIAFQRTESVRERLAKLVCPRFINEERYRNGHISIINALPGTDILGVHIPDIKELAKSMRRGGDGNVSRVLDEFVRRAALSTREDAADRLCYEEKILWGLLAGSLKDLQTRLMRIGEYVPYISNWAECDTMCCNSKFKKAEKEKLKEFLTPYFSSGREFEVRFALIMYMCNFLEEDSIEEVFTKISRIDYNSIRSAYSGMKIQPYYVKMGAAWLLATALSKFPEKTRRFVRECRSLPEDTVKLYVRKSRESFRTKTVKPL